MANVGYIRTLKETYSTILVIGIKDKALISKFEGKGVIFKVLAEVQTEKDLSGCGLVLYWMQTVNREEAARITKLARAVCVNCSGFFSLENLSDTLEERIKPTSIEDSQGLDPELAAFILECIPKRKNYNSRDLAKRIRDKARQKNLPQGSLEEIEKLLEKQKKTSKVSSSPSKYPKRSEFDI